MADISRTITAGTPGDVRYIQYNTYYIEYNFLIWQIHPRRLDMASNQQREARKREAEAGSPAAAEPHPQDIAAGSAARFPGPS